MSSWTALEERKRFRDDDLFQFLSKGNEIKYVTSSLEPSLEDQRKQLNEDFATGVISVAFLRSGLNLELAIQRQESVYDSANKRFVIHSRFVLDGVHVIFKGYICEDTLCGIGRIEYDDNSTNNSK